MDRSDGVLSNNLPRETSQLEVVQDMWITRQIKAVMLIAGVLTSTMIYAAVAPQAALLSTFGEGLDGPVAEVVVRNWGALIGLVGAMLIYGAFSPPHRRLVLMVAGSSKAIFIALVLSHGNRFLSHQAGVAIVVDTLFVILFALYLAVPTRQGPPAA